MEALFHCFTVFSRSHLSTVQKTQPLKQKTTLAQLHTCWVSFGLSICLNKQVFNRTLSSKQAVIRPGFRIPRHTTFKLAKHKVTKLIHATQIQDHIIKTRSQAPLNFYFFPTYHLKEKNMATQTRAKKKNASLPKLK